MTVSTHGAQVPNLPARERSDAVLMDWRIPPTGGRAAAQAPRPQPELHDQPVIMVTAHTSATARAKALGAGMTDCITSPIDIDALLATLSRRVEAHL